MTDMQDAHRAITELRHNVGVALAAIERLERDLYGNGVESQRDGNRIDALEHRVEWLVERMDAKDNT